MGMVQKLINKYKDMRYSYKSQKIKSWHLLENECKI